MLPIISDIITGSTPLAFIMESDEEADLAEAAVEKTNERLLPLPSLTVDFSPSNVYPLSDPPSPPAWFCCPFWKFLFPIERLY